MLVELESGVRMFVVKHTRDCDQEPLYSLGPEHPDSIDPTDIVHGYGEESLAVVPGTVFVVTCNDFPHCVFDTKEAADAFCAKQDQKDLNGRRIYWRVHELPMTRGGDRA